MSIFHEIKSFSFQKRILFFLTVLCCLIFVFPIYSYAEQGDEVTEGTLEEPSESDSIVFTKNVYHQHVGSSQGGGCYSIQRTGQRTVEVPCGGTMVYWPEIDKSSCSRCGAGYYGDQSGRGCWHSETETVSYTYYDLGCGKSSETLLGTLTLEQSETGWVKNLNLVGSYEMPSGLVRETQPYIWNDQAPSESNTYEVTASGTYTLSLNADASVNTQNARIVVEVRNVDVTAPVIKGHTQEPASDWTKDGVLVCLTETADLQPDGSDGCGLHQKPFSYDNGETWTDENTHLYMENGTHAILVRDRLENVSSYEVSFKNVDCTPPTVESTEWDLTKNIRSTVLTITASDLQPDGSEGCGLDEEPFSYDGGKTWTAQNSYLISKNGTLSIAVRDKLGNMCLINKSITNIDCTGPSVEYKMVSDSWTNRDVTLYLSAKDKNEDGSDGIGLEDNWYSLDGGNSWSNKCELVFEENTQLTLTARDRHDNRTTLVIKIVQIDKEEPWVSLKMEIFSEESDIQVKLQAYAGDAYSGLPENAYSWDKGASFSERSFMIIKENGIYQVKVRDKAGNINCAQITVDVFPALLPVLPLIPDIEETLEAVEPETEIESTEEMETEVTEVTMEELVEAPEKIPVQTLQEDSIWEKVLGFLLLLLGIGLLILLALWIWSRSIAVYAEDASGDMQYIGRLWIRRRDDHYMVDITESIIDMCMTMHLMFKPSSLFADLHKDEEMHFVFPEGACVTLTIERKMEME